jgi:hypothetical protein
LLSEGDGIVSDILITLGIIFLKNSLFSSSNKDSSIVPPIIPQVTDLISEIVKSLNNIHNSHSNDTAILSILLLLLMAHEGII